MEYYFVAWAGAASSWAAERTELDPALPLPVENSKLRRVLFWIPEVVAVLGMAWLPSLGGFLSFRPTLFLRTLLFQSVVLGSSSSPHKRNGIVPTILENRRTWQASQQEYGVHGEPDRDDEPHPARLHRPRRPRRRKRLAHPLGVAPNHRRRRRPGVARLNFSPVLHPPIPLDGYILLITSFLVQHGFNSINNCLFLLLLLINSCMVWFTDPPAIYFFNPCNRARASPLYLRALLAPIFFPEDRVSSAFCLFQFQFNPQHVIVHHFFSLAKNYGMKFL